MQDEPNRRWRALVAAFALASGCRGSGDAPEFLGAEPTAPVPQAVAPSAEAAAPTPVAEPKPIEEEGESVCGAGSCAVIAVLKK